MSAKREAELTYLVAVRNSMLDHINTTEASLRALPGMSEKEAKKLVAAVHKRHEKLLRRIDRQIGDDKTAES